VSATTTLLVTAAVGAVELAGGGSCASGAREWNGTFGGMAKKELGIWITVLTVKKKNRSLMV
jgi:hypothetical protein